MATTIPALTSVNDILDTDLVMVTHSEGSSFKISGAELKKNFDIIIAQGTTVSGPGLHAGSTIRIYFSTTLTANNASTALVINYNNVNVTVKAPKDGSLIDYVAKAVGNSYVYCQAYTTLELLYDGTNFVIIGNPVVISNSDYTIYTDGVTTYANRTRQINISDIGYDSSKIYIDEGYTRLYYNDTCFWGVLWYIAQQPIGAWTVQMTITPLYNNFKMKQQYIRSLIGQNTMVSLTDFQLSSVALETGTYVGLFFCVGIEHK